MSITRNDDAPRVLLVDIDDPGAALRIYLDAADATDDTADDILDAALADAMSAYDADRREAS